MTHYCIPFLFSLLLATWSFADSFPTFDEVDYVTAQDPSVFQAMWSKASSENVRIALFGDSQETSPGGAGNRYIPLLNHELFKHFGKVGESFVAPSFNSFGGGLPPAEWLLQGSPGSSNGTLPGTLTASQRLPGLSSRIYTNSAFGQNTLLDTTNANLANDTEIPTSPLWDSGDDIYATIFGVTSPGSEEFAWRASPTDGNLNFFLPNSQAGVTAMGLDAPAGQIVSQAIGPLPQNDLLKQQLIVAGSGSNGSELAGVRFTNASTPGGVSIQDFAAGGYTTTSFLNNHSDAGPMLKAIGSWDAILIHTGANDAYSGLGRTAQQHQDDVSTIIATIRGPDWLNDPNQKFIVVTDPYRVSGNPLQDLQFDQYAGAIAELAENDEYLMAVNSRRLTEELGWNASNPTQFLSDGVHYNAVGAQMMAFVDSQLMLFLSVPEPTTMLPLLCFFPLMRTARRNFLRAAALRPLDA
jgi:lysophospholipase L1-like esterase